MMEPLGVNTLLEEENPGSSPEDKVDFDAMGIMDSTDLDKAFNDDLDKLMNQSDAFDLDGLDGSSEFLDGLKTMPFVDVEDDQVEGLLRSIEQQGDIPIPYSSTIQNTPGMQ